MEVYILFIDYVSYELTYSSNFFCSSLPVMNFLSFLRDVMESFLSESSQGCV